MNEIKEMNNDLNHIFEIFTGSCIKRKWCILHGYRETCLQSKA